MAAITVLAEHHRSSRGHVRCDSCGRTIARGTRYDEIHACDYRDIWTYRACPACQDALPWSYDPYSEDDYGTLGWLQDWADRMLDTHLWDGVTDLIDSLADHDPADAMTRAVETARQDAAYVEEADRTHPLHSDGEAVAALIWRMRTSPAVHPDGVTNTPEETHL